MNRIQIILLVACLGGAALFLKSCFKSDEAEIRAQLAKLEELVSFPAEKSQLQSVTKAKQLSELFTENVTVDIRVSGKSVRRDGSRKEVMQAAMGLRNQVQSLEASLHDINVMLAEDRSTAQVEATGRAKIAGERSSVVESFIFNFIKTEDEWLIQRVENAPAFR